MAQFVFNLDLESLKRLHFTMVYKKLTKMDRFVKIGPLTLLETCVL